MIGGKHLIRRHRYCLMPKCFGPLKTTQIEEQMGLSLADLQQEKTGSETMIDFRIHVIHLSEQVAPKILKEFWFSRKAYAYIYAHINLTVFEQ